MNTYAYNPNIYGIESSIGGSVEEILKALIPALSIVFIILLFCLPIVILEYVFMSISLQTLSRRRQVSKSWFAWVPVFNLWLMGAIASDYDKQNGKRAKWHKRLLITYILFLVFDLIAGFVSGFATALSSSNSELALILLLIALAFYLVVIVFSIIYCVFYYITIYKIFKSTAGDLAWLFLLLAIFVPISLCICLFVFRKKGYEVMPEDNLVVEQING